MRTRKYWAHVLDIVSLSLSDPSANSFSGRVNYEESMMVRLSVSKREKGLRKRASAMSSQLHSLTHFSDISALTGGTAHLDVVSVGYNGSRSHHAVSHTWAFHTASSGRVLVLRMQYYPLLLFVRRTRILLKSGRRYPRKVGRRKVRAPVGVRCHGKSELAYLWSCLSLP